MVLIALMTVVVFVYSRAASRQEAYSG
jgi:hypothetical protein